MTLLIFDCDGVLVDSEILHMRIETAIGREFLSIDRDPLAHGRLFTGRGLRHLFAVWEGEYGKSLPPGIEGEMADRKREAFSSQLQAIPFIADALEALAAIPRCVASGTPLPTLEIALKSTGLYRYFTPHLYSSTMVKRGKPAPDLFLYAAEKMAARPDDCIVIEDSEHGIAAALAAGMRVIGFVGGSHCDATHTDRLHRASLLFDDMRDLPALLARLGA